MDDQLRQCVHALTHLYLTHFGQAGEEDVLRLLLSYCRVHPQDEDALRSLLELLNKRGRYQEVLEWYEQLETTLEEVGPDKRGKMRSPQPLTAEITDFARLKLREHQQAKHPLVLVADKTSLSVPQLMKGEENAEAINRSMDLPVGQALAALDLTHLPAPNTFLNIQSSEQLLALTNPSNLDEPTSEALHHFAVLTGTCRHLSEGNELQIAERIL